MSGISDRIKKLIEAGDITGAIVAIRDAVDYREAEEVVFSALESNNDVLIEEALERFARTHTACDRYRMHGYWVHSVSHFFSDLYRRRLYGWIKKFNKMAWEGANQLGDDNCSDRLVNNFLYDAPWDADPAEFFFTEAMLAWELNKRPRDDWDSKNQAKIRARLTADKFASEITALHFRLEYLIEPTWSNILQGNVVPNFAAMLKVRQRLAELGSDEKLAIEAINAQAQAHIGKLEAAKAALGNSEDDQYRRKISSGEIDAIQKLIDSI